jgi:hypothetical protein
VVRQDGSEVSFDWSHSESLEWAFLYSDCEHEVLPVTSGHRVTIQYNIFDTPSELIASDPLIHADSRLTFFNATMDTLLNANQALTLGFALRHEYPRDRQSDGNLEDLEERLKGYDRVLLQAIVTKGLAWEFRVVWKIRQYDWMKRDRDIITRTPEYLDAMAKWKADPAGAYKSDYDNEFRARREMSDDLIAEHEERINWRWDLPFRHRCLTTKNYQVVDSAYMETDLLSYLERKGRAQARDDVLWISRPRRYNDEVSYTSYGNEAQAASAYAALAMFVKLPSQRPVNMEDDI